MSYLVQPNGYYIANNISDRIVNEVPPGFYSIQFDSDSSQFYLSEIEPFTINHKVYGRSDRWSDRIIQTYLERKDKTTSAAFVGEKGSGKSLLLKRICIDFTEKHNGIVLVVDQAYAGTSFNKFLQDISQDKIVVIDEFEKTYSDLDTRNAILSLLDGTWPQHTLFLITANTTLYNNSLEYFNNRPGRIYFNIEFKSVDLEIITEYLEDNLVDKSRTQEIIQFIGKFSSFNMDMLSVIVSEVNRYPSETVDELSVILNIKPTVDHNSIEFKYELVDVESNHKYDLDWVAGLTSNNIVNFIQRPDWSLNVYTYDDDESKLASSLSFDENFTKAASIQQNPETKTIIIEQHGKRLTVTPKYRDYYSQNRNIYL